MNNIENWSQQHYQGWDHNQNEYQDRIELKKGIIELNMLSNLSNNLMNYQSSYKKQKKQNSVKPGGCQNLKKRKRTHMKLKLKFEDKCNICEDVLQNTNENKQNDCNNRHTNNESVCLENNIKLSSKTEGERIQRSNRMRQLQSMFKVLKQVDNLNQSILPFKVNMNKISNKRIVANMIFKQFNNKKLNTQENQKVQKPDSASFNIKSQLIKLNNKLNSEYKQQKPDSKQTTNGEFATVKHRLYSLDIRNEEDNLKRKIYGKSLRIKSNDQNKNIFQLNINNVSLTSSFGKKNRSLSVRKPDFYVREKSIQEIRNNYTRLELRPAAHEVFQKIKTRQNKIKIRNKENIMPQKLSSLQKNQHHQTLNLNRNSVNQEPQNQHFSDSKFFIERQVSNETCLRNNCLKK